MTVADAAEYLGHHEFELALGIAEDLGDAWPADASFWALLAASAAEMNLDRTER